MTALGWFLLGGYVLPAAWAFPFALRVVERRSDLSPPMVFLAALCASLIWPKAFTERGK